MKLWDIAHSRTGDKGNISNISLIAYDPKDYDLLKEKVTPEKVKEHFKGMVQHPRPQLRDVRRSGRRRHPLPVRGYARQGPVLLSAGYGNLTPLYILPISLMKSAGRGQSAAPSAFFTSVIPPADPVDPGGCQTT